jgi:ferredoxin-thioredoxin reductase catalytic subunit
MWGGEKSCPCRDSNSDPSVVQPVASRCTPATDKESRGIKNRKHNLKDTWKEKGGEANKIIKGE